MRKHNACSTVYPQPAIVGTSMPQRVIHGVAPLSQSLFRLLRRFPETSDSTHRQGPQRMKNGEKGYDAPPPAGSGRRLSISRKRNAPMMNKHMPKAVGMATARKFVIANEIGWI